MEATGLKRRPVAPRLPCTENSPGAFKDQKGIASLERVIFRFPRPSGRTEKAFRSCFQAIFGK
jgi:hypothetical protein